MFAKERADEALQTECILSPGILWLTSTLPGTRMKQPLLFKGVAQEESQGKHVAHGNGRTRQSEGKEFPPEKPYVVSHEPWFPICHDKAAQESCKPRRFSLTLLLRCTRLCYAALRSRRSHAIYGCLWNHVDFEYGSIST